MNRISNRMNCNKRRTFALGNSVDVAIEKRGTVVANSIGVDIDIEKTQIRKDKIVRYTWGSDKGIQFASVCNSWRMSMHQSQQRNVWLTSSRITRPRFVGTAIEQRGIFPKPNCASIMETRNQTNPICVSGPRGRLWESLI